MAVSSSLDHLSNRMKLEWYSKLNTEMVPSKNYRRTSIIGTIGMLQCVRIDSLADNISRAQDEFRRENQRPSQRYGMLSR